LFVEEFSLQRIIRRRIFRPQGFFFERRIIQRGILLAKNTPSEESSGRRILRRRIFRPDKKILVAKNFPAKNHPSEELSGEELSGIINKFLTFFQEKIRIFQESYQDNLKNYEIRAN
jgi:hypothetical protein